MPIWFEISSIWSISIDFVGFSSASKYKVTKQDEVFLKLNGVWKIAWKIVERFDYNLSVYNLRWGALSSKAASN
ncbi:hypothetical protein VNO77_04021 [Canavalia gladiata]|uniref:Uncharacterized protein n=1 Tax=Canavalia gladiata TaxID=3824 RepID=A0AAN9N0Z0_CANGL